MRTVLITAASGSAGNKAVEALVLKGFRVVATSRDPKRLSFGADVETRTYDADDTHTDFKALLSGVDDLVLIGPPLDGLVHTKIKPLIDAATARKINHIVYLSGNYLAGFTGRTLAALPIRKIEQQVIDSGLKHTIVRAGFFMDNYTSGFYSTMVKNGNIALATANGKTALVAAADVGEFIAEALFRGLTGEYLVTGPEALDHFEVAALLSLKEDRVITYTPLTEEELLSVYRSRNLPAESADYGLTLYRAFRNFTTAAITDGFRQATGRDPMSFRTFLGLDS